MPVTFLPQDMSRIPNIGRIPIGNSNENGLDDNYIITDDRGAYDLETIFKDNCKKDVVLKNGIVASLMYEHEGKNHIVISVNRENNRAILNNQQQK